MTTKPIPSLSDRHAWLSAKVRLLADYLPNAPRRVHELAMAEYRQTLYELEELRLEQHNRASMAAGSEA